MKYKTSSTIFLQLFFAAEVEEKHFLRIIVNKRSPDVVAAVAFTDAIDCLRLPSTKVLYSGTISSQRLSRLEQAETCAHAEGLNTPDHKLMIPSVYIAYSLQLQPQCTDLMAKVC